MVTQELVVTRVSGNAPKPKELLLSVPALGIAPQTVPKQRMIGGGPASLGVPKLLDLELTSLPKICSK